MSHTARRNSRNNRKYALFHTPQLTKARTLLTHHLLSAIRREHIAECILSTPTTQIANTKQKVADTTKAKRTRTLLRHWLLRRTYDEHSHNTSYSAFAYRRKMRRRERIGREQTKACSAAAVEKIYAIVFGNKNKWIKAITRCAKSDTLATLTTSKKMLQGFTKRGTPASNQGPVTDRALPCRHGYQEKKPDAGKAAFLIKLNLVLKHWRLATETRGIAHRTTHTKHAAALHKKTEANATPPGGHASCGY